MLTLRTFALTVLLAGCAITEKTPSSTDAADSPEAASAASTRSNATYQYIGTYEHFATPMGSSISVLIVDGQKIKLAAVDDTRYINIALNKGIPEMRLYGTYGINGELKESPAAIGDVFIVREIEHLGGGQVLADTLRHRTLPDFFTVDGSARGPLSLSELQIEFPDSLARYFNDEERECFLDQVEFRAADLGDPLTMPPIRRVLLTNSQQKWAEMTDAQKRLQLARYVTSMALHAC